jgi:uncharacterized protein (TIGR00266 family)
MPITFDCPCGKALRVNDDMAGKRVRCPGCQAVLTVPLEAQPADAVVYEHQVEPPSAPPVAASARRSSSRRCHAIDYKIIGDDLQLIEITLDPGETVVAEAGAMTYMEDGMKFETRMGDGSEPNQGIMGKLWGAGKRVLAGESLFMTHFTNQGNGRQIVAFGAPYPGKIIPVDMAVMGGELICQRNAFLCAAYGMKLEVAFQKKIGVGLFGGEGFILQRLTGDGLAFMHACGAIIERQLNGETLRVDTGCIVAFQPSVEYDIQAAGGLKSMIFGGEGIFLAKLSGHGKVWLQSLPFHKLASRIVGGSRGGKEGGGVLGGLADVFSD